MLLRDQDRSRWDAAALATGEAYLERAAAHHRPGPYQLQAAIAACHASSPSWEETDWLQIVTLYDVLAHRDPSPVPRLNRAVALAQLGPEHADRALAEVDALDRPARRLPPLPRDPGRAAHRPRAATTRPADANRTALALTTNDAERRLLTTRLHRHPLSDGS